MENTICNALLLTSQEVAPKDLQVTKYQIERKLKHNVQIKCKNLQQKSLELSRLKFLVKVFVSECMCFENHQLTYKCRKLKNLEKSIKPDSTIIWSTYKAYIQKIRGFIKYSVLHIYINI